MSQNINTVDISNDANLEDYVLVSVNGSLRRVKVADLKELVDSTEDVVVVDTELSTTSVNPVQNRVITTELNKKANSSDMSTYQTKRDNTLTTTSKEVVGAINENTNSINQLSGGKADKSDVNELKEELVAKKDVEYYEWTYQNSNIIKYNEIAQIQDNEINYTKLTGYNVYKVDVPYNTDWLQVTKSITSGTYPIYVDDKGNCEYLKNVDNIRIHKSGGYIIFNRSSINGYDGVKIKLYNEKYPNVYSKETFNSNGLIQNGNISNNVSYVNHKITDLRHAYYEDIFLPVSGSCFDENDKYLGELSKIKNENDDYVFDYPNGTSYFIANQNLNEPKYDLKLESKIPINTEIIGHTCGRFNFDGKTITLLGDSIAYGTEGTNGSRTDERWINLFTSRNNCTCTNIAIGGATIAMKSSNSIINQLPNIVDSDFIFIAGGTNDYGESIPLGTPESTSNTDLFGAMKEICEFLKNNYSDKNIVFILPINRPGTVANNTPLSEYRNIIRCVASEYKFNVIDGYLFGFPEYNGYFRNAIIPDGVHPSVQGHYMYSYAFENAIVK